MFIGYDLKSSDLRKPTGFAWVTIVAAFNTQQK